MTKHKDRQSDSVTHHEDRREKMKVEAAENQRLAAEAEAQRESSRAEREQAIRAAETQELTQQAGLVQQGDTREMLLERIRQQREEDKPANVVEQPVFQSESHQKQVEAEQQAGREAIARAEAELEKNRELRRMYEEEERLRQGTMETVHHANPSMTETFPTSKATLK